MMAMYGLVFCHSDGLIFVILRGTLMASASRERNKTLPVIQIGPRRFEGRGHCFSSDKSMSLLFYTSNRTNTDVSIYVSYLPLLASSRILLSYFIHANGAVL